MRTLRFLVEGQIIRKDPNCDFSDLVPGSEGYLQAEFSFSPEWKDCVKVASFYSVLGKEYEPQMLKDGRTCLIPEGALKREVFKVQVIGRSKFSNTKLVTNKVEVRQNGG
jgi:hypothetical protein